MQRNILSISQRLKRRNKMRYMCQCKRGHVFDYRERIKFPINNKHYAPCQGKCPKCGETMFSFIGSGTNVYPIKFNYTG